MPQRHLQLRSAVAAPKAALDRLRERRTALADPLDPFAKTIARRLTEESGLVVVGGLRDGRLSFLSPAGARRLRTDLGRDRPRVLWDVVAQPSRLLLRSLLDEGRSLEHVAVVFGARQGSPLALDCSLSIAGDRFVLVEHGRGRALDVETPPASEPEERIVELEHALQGSRSELKDAVRRVVAVRDDERRRVRQDIHDGAQQQLLAVAIGLELAAERATRVPDLRDQLRALRAQLDAAVEALREIAHGIFPARARRARDRRRPPRGDPRLRAAGRRPRRGGRPLPARNRDRRLLLVPGGRAERRQALRRRAGSSSSSWRTTRGSASP